MEKEREFKIHFLKAHKELLEAIKSPFDFFINKLEQKIKKLEEEAKEKLKTEEIKIEQAKKEEVKKEKPKRKGIKKKESKK